MMVVIRSSNEIIQSLVDFYRLALPNLDTKPGTVSRDLFIEGLASVSSILYDELGGVSIQQSMRLVTGSDLDKLAQNFGLTRKQSTPATGTALLTFSSINSTININTGSNIIANNGIAFAVSAGIAVTTANANFYRSIASKFSDQLNTAGITDQYAVQVTVSAISSGSTGNIGSYSLARTTIPGVTNVTNVVAFAGGTDQESDATFRTRILASFSGSSVGTALGYLNVALSIDGVSDAYVVEPGDPLMTRDGTVVKKNADGSLTIVSEGSGGKVDLIVLGSNLVQNTESFIYRDKSNNNDPANPKNNIVLGRIAADANKTINRKRIDDIANGTLPTQPVSTILDVTGSVSGSNFLPKSVDSLGRVSGNYDFISDTGPYGRSPWGFDTFKWINNKILFSEDLIKGQSNGQDAVTFTSVLDIPRVQQNISITNENSIVTFDRSIIRLLHTPSTNVTRVFNVYTGERYIVTNQNLDNTGIYNTTGRIQISGNTLPSPSDQLQVDYNWIVDYDPYSDYDGLYNTSNPRSVSNSVDWGLSSVVHNEEISFAKDISSGFWVGTAINPINAVISANTFLEINGVVSKINSGLFTNRLSVTVSNLISNTLSIDSITLKNNNTELYSTAQNNGSFTNIAIVVGIQVRYNTTIILPSDTTAEDGDKVTVILNSKNVFQGVNTTGSVNNSQITIPNSLITTTANNIILKVTYISSISDLFSLTTTTLPASRIGNGIILNNSNGFNNFSQTNLIRRENQTIQKNTSNQIYAELNVLSTDYSLTTSQIISVIRLSDNNEVWNSDNTGTIIVGNSGNYQLIFNGFNTPTTGDNILVIYYTSDIKRFQPFSYSKAIIKNRLDTATIDLISNRLSIPLNNIKSQTSNVSFTIIEPNTDIILFTVTDGQLSSNINTATLTSLSVNFSTLPDILNKKIKITKATISSNDGQYDIIGYNISSNTITITNILDNIIADQISVIRISDGKEIWGYLGTIDIVNNRLLLPPNALANNNDKVYVILYNFNILRQAATKIIGTVTDQVTNAGVLTISGTTIFKANDIIFTATNTGLKLNIAEAVRKYLNLPSTSSNPNNIKLAKIAKLEKVITNGVTDDSVLEVLATYDLKNSIIQNNLLFNSDFLSDPSLLNLDFILPMTHNNTLNGTINNLPTLGDKIRITFYYTIDNDLENLSYTRNGIIYTNKKFAIINNVFISSGFKTSQSTKFTATSFTQPGLGSRYKVFYDYTAPTQNERIVITYNYNKIISDVTFDLENTRPINADVLAKQAIRIMLDLTMNVVILDSYLSSTTTVLQNLKNQLISAMTTTKLGQIVDQVTLINAAQSVAGIARARIVYFNRTGVVGSILSAKAQNNEYLTANSIIINTETR